MKQPDLPLEPRVECDEPCEYLPRLAKARRSLLPAKALTDTSALFRVLGDPMRLQIIHLLNDNELCVCDLTELLEAGQSTVSNHLRVLRAHRLVSTRKQGKLVFYTLAAPELARYVAPAIAQAARW